MYIEWSNTYRVHVTKIDEQHEAWINRLNRLAKIVIDTASQPGWDSRVKQMHAIVELVEEARKYTEYHFAAEEKWMQECGFPGYDHHRESHEQFRKMIATIAQKADEGNLPKMKTLLQTLFDWVTQHIMGVDQELGYYLSKKHPALSAL